MLDTDDVIRVRVAAQCWNDGRHYGNMGKIFFQLLHSDPFVKHWYLDAEGYKLCALRYPIMESFRRVGLQEAEVFNPSHDLRTPESEDMSRSAEERIYDLFINHTLDGANGPLAVIIAMSETKVHREDRLRPGGTTRDLGRCRSRDCG